MILYILDIKDIKNKRKNFFIISVICLICGIIYELFSHQVYSIFMIGAFVIPLVMGTIIPSIVCKIKMPSNIENNLYNASIATFTFGSFINGFLNIYGTTNSKIWIYFIVGIILLCISVANYILRK